MRTLFRLLLRAFPRRFRKAFGAGMLEDLLLDYRRARRRGAGRAVLFIVASATDLVTSGLEERVSPVWRRKEAEGAGRGEMRDTLASWTRDFLHAARNLRRDPAFTLVSAGTLALAIGANAGMFSVVDAVLLEPLPYADSDQLVWIGASGPGSNLPDEFGVSAEFLIHYREESQLLESVAAGFGASTKTVRAEDRVERVRVSTPTMELFRTLGVDPILGRLPTEEEEGALVSHALWTTWFGADSSVIGRRYEVAGERRTILGVMPPDFWFPVEDVAVWVPYAMHPQPIQPGQFGLSLVGRMAPGVTPEQLGAELTRLALRLPERFGGSPAYARFIREHHRAVVRPLRKELLGEVTGPLWLLLGSVGIVLLIACANVANLFAVRAERRERVLAVSRALGASRAQLVRSLMAEAVLVAGLAGGLAIALAWVTVPVLLTAAPPNIPRLAEVSIDPSTLLFTLGASIISALLCGLAPAVRASAPDIARLREAGRGSTRRRHRIRDALVVVQTSLALLLLIGSALLGRSYMALRDVDPGYETEDVLTFQFAPEQEHLRDGPSWAAFHLGFMERLQALPGVEAVGVVHRVPLEEDPDDARYVAEGTTAGEEPPLLHYNFASGGYFQAMGIDVLRGRGFGRTDQTSRAGSVLVSASAAELLWPGQDPIGRRIRNREWGDAWETVVGVVEDVRHEGLRDAPRPMIYHPLVRPDPNPHPISTPGYVVKSARAAELVPQIRTLVRGVAPEAPIYRVHTLESLAARSMVELSFTALTLGIASMLAVILGAVGLFAVLSYVVAERIREIGVRMALGAQASEVRRMVVLQGGRVALLGTVIGALAGLGASRVLESLLFEVVAVDAPTFIGTAAFMFAVALLASYVPARRASSVDPIRSLGAE